MFGRNIKKGLKEFERGVDPFDLYQSYGLTPEIFKEELANRGLAYDEKQFELAKKKHQEISRAGAENTP